MASKMISSAYKFIDRSGETNKEFYKTPQKFVHVIFDVTRLRAPGALLAMESTEEENDDR
jgi:hypothetical protein